MKRSKAEIEEARRIAKEAEVQVASPETVGAAALACVVR
jgi:hypothetical protein